MHLFHSLKNAPQPSAVSAKATELLSDEGAKGRED